MFGVGKDQGGAPIPRPAPWISWRTYRLDGADESKVRTLLLNQIKNEFLLLEGLSSDLWDLICSGSCSPQDISSSLSLPAPDITSFLEELTSAGLITFQNPPQGHEPYSGFESTHATPASKDLEKEMMTWAYNNGFIYAAHWELTYHCNEACIHCYNPGAAHSNNEKPNRNTQELDTHEAKEMLHQLVDLGVFRLTMSGGEPTLRKDFLEILAYARNLGFQVVIYTNGLKPPPAFLEKMVSLYPESVELTVYSASPEQHDAITRVPGSFKKTMQSLSFFRKKGIRTVFKSSLTNGTAGNWKNTLNLGRSVADRVILSTIISQGVDGKEAPLSTAAEFAQLVILAATPGSPIYVGGEAESWGRESVPHGNQKPCGAGHDSIAITPEGKIYPCISFPMVIGDFRTGDLPDLRRLPPLSVARDALVFSNRDPAELLDQWRSVGMIDMAECGNHERCYYCGDICPGDAFVQNKSPLSAASNHCRQAYARMIASQHLRSGNTLKELMDKFFAPDDFGLIHSGEDLNIKLHEVQ